MKTLLLTAAVISFKALCYSQEVPLLKAQPVITLQHQDSACHNNSGVAFNPERNLYYAVRAGNSSFHLETWTGDGKPVAKTNAGFDWRGMWWNPLSKQVEGNGFTVSGIWAMTLDENGNATNTGMHLFQGMHQPDHQSCGDFNWKENEILYFNDGSIHRYSRATGTFIASVAISGTPAPLENLNSTTLFYTGHAGFEIGLLDYVTKQLYLYEKSTGKYAGMCPLPADAVTSSMFRASWAGEYLFLFDLTHCSWAGYQIFGPPAVVDSPVVEEPNIGEIVITAPDPVVSTIEAIKCVTVVSLCGRIIPQRNIEPIIEEFYGDPEPIDVAENSANKANALAPEMLVEEGLSVFPNPTTGTAYVKGVLPSNVKIDIVNAVGEKIFSSLVQEREIDLAGYPAGVYFIQVSNHDESHSLRLVKM